MNDLFGQPVKPATKPVAGTFHTERRTQKTMLSGLDCLPGQRDLFEVDGAAPAPVDPRVAIIAKINAKGHRGIPLDVADELARQVGRGYHINGTDYNGFRLTFHVSPRTDLSTKARFDLEMAIGREYGNAPNVFGTEFTGYSVSFYANS